MWEAPWGGDQGTLTITPGGRGPRPLPLSRARNVERGTFLLDPFRQQEGDVVGLGAILSEVLDGIQNALLKRSGSFAAVFLDELDQPLLFEHVAFHVLGFGQPVRIDDEKIALVELNRSGAVVCKVKGSQDQIFGSQLFDRSILFSVKIGRIVPCPDVVTLSSSIQG